MLYWRGPVAIAPWFLYRLYMQKWLSKLFPAVWTCCAVESVLTSVVCTQETCRRKLNLFSLIHMNWRASVSVSVSVCKNLLLKSGFSMYDTFLRTLYICALHMCGNLIIPVCILLLIFKHCVNFLYQILNTRDIDHSNDNDAMTQEKADHLLPS